jgi:hypothetical protein
MTKFLFELTNTRKVNIQILFILILFILLISFLDFIIIKENIIPTMYAEELESYKVDVIKIRKEELQHIKLG